MVFSRDYEIARPSALPNWMKEFADSTLRRTANGTNPFRDIKDLFDRKTETKAIEDRVRELKDRIGLSRLAEQEKEEETTKKTASLQNQMVNRLARLANWLDQNACQKEAAQVDGILKEKASEEAINKLFDQYPKLRQFVDNVIKSRLGHISVPALLKMVRDERPHESQAASDPILIEYITGKIGTEKQEVDDGGDNIAGLGVGLSTSTDDLSDNERMFEPSKATR